MTVSAAFILNFWDWKLHSITHFLVVYDHFILNFWDWKLHIMTHFLVMYGHVVLNFWDWKLHSMTNFLVVYGHFGTPSSTWCTHGRQLHKTILFTTRTHSIPKDCTSFSQYATFYHCGAAVMKEPLLLVLQPLHRNRVLVTTYGIMGFFFVLFFTSGKISFKNSIGIASPFPFTPWVCFWWYPSFSDP